MYFMTTYRNSIKMPTIYRVLAKSLYTVCMEILALVLVRGMAVAQVAGPDTIHVVYPDDTVAVRLHSADPADPTL